MAKVNRTLMVGEDIVEVAPDNLPAAAANAKGAVKKGAGVAKDQDPKSIADEKLNTVLDSLRHSGVVANDKFVVFYNKNFPQGVEEGGGIPVDLNVYLAGQTATVKFDDDGDVPYCQGYNFIGWALSASASTPDYPYDENDPQTYTLTFVDDDITLYAVWEALTYTLTYSLGEYGQGSVPAAQTVEEGETVNLSFSPAPTVNDGSGRVFVGWATVDGATLYMQATYRADGLTTITPYDDVVLYPVFLAERTLTYALGNDGTGSVPQGGTYYNGQTAPLSFSPEPTCVSDPSKSFLGWATSDEQSTATYPKGGMMNFVTMNSDITLYPAFGVVQSYTATYNLGAYGTGSVPSPTTGSLSGMPGYVTYYLSFSPEPSCTRAGNWAFTGWSTTDGQTSFPTYPKTNAGMPTTVMAQNLTLYPVFEEVQLLIVDNMGVDDVIVQNVTLGTSTTVYSQSGETGIANVEGNTLNISSSTQMNASFTGVYDGNEYNGQTLSWDSKNSMWNNPKGTSVDWVFQSGDYGTITVTSGH